MARRFIVEDKDISNIGENKIEIFGSEVKHIQVLRHNIGDKIEVNKGMYEIVTMKRESIVLEFVENAKEVGVPNTCITLYMAMLKTDKMDYVIQKAVETGVSKIVPFFSINVVVKLEDKARAKRIEKLQKIADEACKQCGRTDSVKVLDFVSFSKLKEMIKDNTTLFAYEASKDSLKREIMNIKENGTKDINIVIGAEGGFTPKEAEELQEIPNVKCVSLGDRILRAETAAINLVSIVMYEMEE